MTYVSATLWSVAVMAGKAGCSNMILARQSRISLSKKHRS
ncbi:hypothetical protein FOMG_19802 [Fusarium oxysporum f. sp. melonis 26406]|uniref:Uncharacterized protein n=1 Tax=Fusarium oxysporum f. sp. melonis 26406 TaxID=1089452 RepID=W9Z575_FUSOX|nr:hypothetical protein FOMG_19802 [Fusarium oxysporum f. sp. melonis 26406]